MKEIKVNNFIWIDLCKPRYSEIKNIGNRFNLHPVVVEDFSAPTLRPKAVEYENCLYLAIHIPVFDKAMKTTFPGEVDIAITPEAVITSHDREVYSLTGLMNEIKNGKIKEKSSTN